MPNDSQADEIKEPSAGITAGRQLNRNEKECMYA